MFKFIYVSKNFCEYEIVACVMEVSILYTPYLQHEKVACIRTLLHHNSNSIEFQFISMQSSWTHFILYQLQLTVQSEA